MKAEVTYKTKLVDVTRVRLDGEVAWSQDEDWDGYSVGGEPVDGWLERFKGKAVELVITVRDHDPDDQDYVKEE